MYITMSLGVQKMSDTNKLKQPKFQYLRQKLRCFRMNPTDFRGLENPLVD